MSITLNMYYCAECPKNSECSDDLKVARIVGEPETKDISLRCKYEGLYDRFGNSLVPIDKTLLELEVPNAIGFNIFGREFTQPLTLENYLEQLGFQNCEKVFS